MTEGTCLLSFTITSPEYESGSGENRQAETFLLPLLARSGVFKFASLVNPEGKVINQWINQLYKDLVT